jgi:DNA-binding NarL/FixJ family response regulator
VSDTIRVVIADDHAIVRSGIRALLATEPDIAVVGEATEI